jgi:hypothetical protein
LALRRWLAAVRKQPCSDRNSCSDIVVHVLLVQARTGIPGIRGQLTLTSGYTVDWLRLEKGAADCRQPANSFISTPPSQHP